MTFNDIHISSVRTSVTCLSVRTIAGTTKRISVPPEISIYFLMNYQYW